jgi:hypothetical protein
VALVVRPGGEEQRVGGPVVRQRAFAELERPQAVDRQYAGGDRIPVGKEVDGARSKIATCSARS